LKGLETYGLDRVNRTDQDALFVLDGKGTQLWGETPDNSGYTTAIKLVRNWDGTNTPYCLAFKRGAGVSPELRDGSGNIVVTIPGETASNACIGDFGGDARQEILMYTVSAATLYAAAQFDYSLPAPAPGKPLKQPMEYANYSRYGSGDPFALLTGATVGTIRGAAPCRPKNGSGIFKAVGNRARLACSTRRDAGGRLEVFDLCGRRIMSRETGAPIFPADANKRLSNGFGVFILCKR
jgi:hypothetical protein